MHRMLAAGPAIVAALGLAGTVLAEEISRTIMAIDPASRMVQLDDGIIYSVDDAVPLDMLQPGSAVTVFFEDGEGAPVITDVKPAEVPQ